jgi:hypothetical protein
MAAPKQNHLRGPALLAFGIAGLLTLHGLAVLGWLLAEPSEGGGFAGFSGGRWGLILLQAILTGAFAFLTHAIWRSAAFISKFGTWLRESGRHAFSLWLSMAVVLVAALVMLSGGAPALASAGFFGRLLPTFVWLAAASAVSLLLLSIHSRAVFAAALRRFFPPPGDHKVVRQPPLRAGRWWLLGLALVYLGLQVRGHLAAGEARWLPDSIDYIFPATFAWTDPVLWTHTKPWGAAVLYKITGPSPVVIGAVQAGISSLAWLALAATFARRMRRARPAVVVFGLLLAFSLTPAVAMWNHIIQSESLSISVMILILASWLGILQRWSWLNFDGLVLLFGLWAGSRETNVYLCLLIAAALIPIGIFWARNRVYWLLSACLLVFAWINLRISELPTIPRWAYPLANVILQRVLPEPDFLAYFEEHGMPAPPELLALSGQPAVAEDHAVFNRRALNEFEAWVFRDGRDTYINFLAAHPAYTALAPLSDRRTLLGSRELDGYLPPGFRHAFPGVVNEALFPTQGPWLILLLVVSTAVVVWQARPWTGSHQFWLLAGFFLLVIPHLYIAWHGDSSEVARHAVQANIQLRLSVWLLLAYSLDRITIRSSDRLLVN